MPRARRAAFDHPTWGPVELIARGGDPGWVCELVVVDAAGTTRWSFATSPNATCYGVAFDATPIDAAGVVHLWFSWGDTNASVALQPTADSLRDFGTLPSNGGGRFWQSTAYDTDGDGRLEIIVTYDCGSDCPPPGYWTYLFDGNEYVTHLSVRPDIDFAAIRRQPGVGAEELGRIPPATCGVVSNVVDRSTGESWRHVWYGGVEGWTHDSLFQLPPAEVADSGPNPTAAESTMPQPAAGPSTPSVTPATSDEDRANSVARQFLEAVTVGDAALAASLELSGRDPTTYSWFRDHEVGDVAPFDPAACLPVDGEMWCQVRPSDESEYLLVVAPTADGAQWLVSHPIWLPHDGPTPDPNRLACVTGTTPLNFRGGPGTDWPNFDAIPSSDCTVMLTDTVLQAQSDEGPWRYVGRGGRQGWVSDLMIEPLGDLDDAVLSLDTPCTPELDGAIVADPADPAFGSPYTCSDGQWVPTF